MKTNIVNIITTLDEGGAEATLFKLAKNSNNLNYKLTVISLMDIGKYGSLLKNKNVNVITLNMNRGKFSLRSFLKLYQTSRVIQNNLKDYTLNPLDIDLFASISHRIASCLLPKKPDRIPESNLVFLLLWSDHQLINLLLLDGNNWGL